MRRSRTERSEGVGSVLVETVVWLVQQGLEARFGPLMVVGLGCVGVALRAQRGSRSRARSSVRSAEKLACVGSVLILFSYLLASR